MARLVIDSFNARGWAFFLACIGGLLIGRYLPEVF